MEVSPNGPPSVAIGIITYGRCSFGIVLRRMDPNPYRINSLSTIISIIKYSPREAVGRCVDSELHGRTRAWSVLADDVKRSSLHVKCGASSMKREAKREA